MADDDTSSAGLRAFIREDGSAELTVDETPQQIDTRRVEDARREIVRRAAEIATVIDAPVPLTVIEPDGRWPLIVHPDGHVDSDEGAPHRTMTEEEQEEAPRRRSSHTEQPEAVEAVAGGQDQPMSAATPAIPPAPPLPSATMDAVPGPPRAQRSSFVTPAFAAEADETSTAGTQPQQRTSFLHAEPVDEPATQSLRGAVNRTFGTKLGPGSTERAERADHAFVAAPWTGPRTIAVVNAKGGSGKTPSTILLAATFARHGGAGVLAWDNNQTRGTLGWRTEQSQHDATLHDLIPEADRLLAPSAQAGDLARFVHHQTRDRFDVLRSQPMMLADQQRISAGDVDRVHAVVTKYYRLIVMDSGNDEADPMWLRMIDRTDQLVVATNTRAEHAEAGALLLEALAARDGRSAHLARGAVAIVSQADQNASGADVRKIVDGFRPLVREVATIPYDTGMIGGQLHLSALRPVTQRAWLAAGAAVARGFATPPDGGTPTV